jgi:hypothetical protein
VVKQAESVAPYALTGAVLARDRAAVADLRAELTARRDCFEIRDGRMRGWRQHSCGAAAAGPHLAGTPPGSAAFALRNAGLAARLRASAGRS